MPETAETVKFFASADEAVSWLLDELKSYMIKECKPDDPVWNDWRAARDLLEAGPYAALEFYADPEIVIGHIVDGKIVASDDHGQRARTALAGARGEKADG